MEKEKASAIFSKGLISENPVLRLTLGTCPTLAITTSAINGLGMGVAATVVLLGSNVMISLLRKVIPDRVRIPAFITIIAGFVTVVQLIVKALAPALDATLGIYLPLIVVNCIILG
uniref:Rnf-Nqr domain containing protein n=2 Tax=Enterococcus TaxID=1350 RepID=UPI00404327A9